MLAPEIAAPKIIPKGTIESPSPSTPSVSVNAAEVVLNNSGNTQTAADLSAGFDSAVDLITNKVFNEQSIFGSIGIPDIAILQSILNGANIDKDKLYWHPVNMQFGGEPIEVTLNKIADEDNPTRFEAKLADGTQIIADTLEELQLGITQLKVMRNEWDADKVRGLNLRMPEDKSSVGWTIFPANDTPKYF
jgi:hypothetical protein